MTVRITGLDKIETTREIDGYYIVERTEKEIMEDVVKAVNIMVDYINGRLPSE